MGGPDAMPAIPGTLAILPVRGFVVFPRTMSPINVQRAASIQLLNETLPQHKIIGLLAQRDECGWRRGQNTSQRKEFGFKQALPVQNFGAQGWR